MKKIACGREPERKTGPALSERPEEGEDRMEGKRTQRPSPAGRRRVVLAAVLGCVALLLAVYLGLCAYVGARGTVLPHVYVLGTDLGGLTQEQAVQAVDQAVADTYGEMTITLACGQTSRELDASQIQADSQAAAQAAFAVGREEMFLKRGAVILAHLAGRGSQVQLQVGLDQEGQRDLEQALSALSIREGDALVETVWTVEEGELILTRGTTGLAVGREEAQELVQRALERGESTRLELSLTEQEPEPVDFQALYDSVHVDAADAYIDPETCTVVPHVVGLSFDPERAAEEFAGVPEGGQLRIPLDQTMPQVTGEELEAKLFADLLGECTTYISGTNNRLSNVILAAQFIHETILMPGDVFSYNETVGPRTSARGFLPAPAYVAGQTVDEVGGGICQDSSTLYLAALRANLKIVERVNHMYAVGYVPDGMDATVAWGAIDFKFENNTDYPIRLVTTVSGRTMRAAIYGTKTDDITVKVTNRTLSTDPAETIYTPDETVPQGTTVVSVTPYTGRRVEAYRNLYDGEGNLISSTLESVNTYRRRDKVILYNPADAESLGLVEPAEPDDPGEGTFLPVDPPEGGEGEQTAPETPPTDPQDPEGGGDGGPQDPEGNTPGEQPAEGGEAPGEQGGGGPEEGAQSAGGGESAP